MSPPLYTQIMDQLCPRMRPFRKWIFSLGLLPFCIYFALHRGRYSLLDNADLIIHEAGHFLFSPFGDFVYLMGGSLMQVIFPLFLAGYFFRSAYWPGVQLFLSWLGQNLINISVYAADADTRSLRLLGGGRHDWFYLLRRMRWLDYADTIGYLLFAFALVVFLLSLALPLFRE